MNQVIRLTNKIAIEESISGFDQFDGESRIWQVKCRVYAQIQSLFNQRQIGSEVAVAKKVVSSNFYQFTIRYRIDLKSDMRILFHDQIYNIIKIISDPSSKKYSRIVAEEVEA